MPIILPVLYGASLVALALGVSSCGGGEIDLTLPPPTPRKFDPDCVLKDETLRKKAQPFSDQLSESANCQFKKNLEWYKTMGAPDTEPPIDHAEVLALCLPFSSYSQSVCFGEQTHALGQAFEICESLALYLKEDAKQEAEHFGALSHCSFSLESQQVCGIFAFYYAGDGSEKLTGTLEVMPDEVRLKIFNQCACETGEFSPEICEPLER